LVVVQQEGSFWDLGTNIIARNPQEYSTKLSGNITNMTHPCDECESRIKLTETEIRIEKVKDMLQAAELLGSRREYTRGGLEMLRKVVEILEPK
jgi:hypothetical protein